jgi:hypothetical protein
MATEPRYTFDPVTQTYTRIDTPVTTPVRGLGPLYDAGGSEMGPQGPVGFGMMDPGKAEMGVGLQNFGQFAAQASPMQMAMSPGMTIGSAIAGNIGNSMMGSQVNSVANPTPATVTSIAPDPAFSGLAAMNAQQAAQNQVNTQQASVANTANAIAGAVVGADPTVSVSDPAADAAANAAAPAADAGGASAAPASDGGGGGGGFDGFSGDNDAGPGSGPGSDPSADFNKGGLAAAAQSVQDQGRGDDKILVHMTPNEVRGLQAIAMQHGGSLTVNPETGLVEAGFLDSILPMVAGAALTIGSGGVINPYMSAAIVGGVTGLASGSLEKGLTAGLSAFGGAGIGTALSAAGAAGTAASTTGQVLTPQVANASTIIPQGAAGAGGATSIALPPQPGLFSLANAPAAPVNATIVPGATGATGGTTGLFSAANAPPPPSFSNAVSGVKGLASPEGRSAFMKEVGGATGLATKVAPAVVGSMFSAEEPDEGGKKPQEYIRPYSFDFNRADADPEFKYRTGAPGESTAEQRYFTPEFKGLGVYKAGTEPGPSFYGTPTAEQLALYSKPKDSPTGLKAGGLAGLGRGGLKDGAFIVPADVVSHLGNGSNDAGQKILARGLGARPIKGKGDGMSDSIPTSIEGKQPARVADGEAYIPPEVVKKVGSKRLYAMMDKIRQARTGTKKQAPEVNPRQFMPA